MASFDLDPSDDDLDASSSFRSDDAVDHSETREKGINPGVVAQISWWRREPEWMKQTRLDSLRRFEDSPMSEWLAVHMADVDFQDIHYFLGHDFPAPRASAPAGERVSEWNDAEALDDQQREQLHEQGVLFCDMDTALREHPHLVERYFGTVVSAGDDKFAALNTSVWSGGSFIYVPPGIDVEMPLQVDSRISSESAGHFERTLIIADEGSAVHYIDGCSAPVYTQQSLRSAVVEIVVKPHARVTYTAIQNWSPNVYNMVAKRACVEAHGHMRWIDGNIGSKLTVQQPSIHLVGEGATGEVLSVAYAGEGQHQDTGAEVVHAATNTTSKIVSKSVSKHGGVTTCRVEAHIDEGITGATSHVECDALILDEGPLSETPPRAAAAKRDAQPIDSEGTVSRITDEQLFYLMSRGLSEEQARSAMVDGFIEPVTKYLPMEYAVEWSRLIELQMEGSVG